MIAVDILFHLSETLLAVNVVRDADAALKRHPFELQNAGLLSKNHSGAAL